MIMFKISTHSSIITPKVLISPSSHIPNDMDEITKEHIAGIIFALKRDQQFIYIYIYIYSNYVSSS
jgi:hypothetical protein